MLSLMNMLSVSERAVRSALSRMTRKGWITPQKHGRRSRYSLTMQGRVLLERGQRRIFEPIITDWDGQWHLIVYSLPEKNRRLRHVLRTQLNWLGFGRIAPGTCISPYARTSEFDSLLNDLNVASYVDMFSGVYTGPSSTDELVHRCWDLTGLERQYKAFIEDHQQDYLRCLDVKNTTGFLEPKECFVRRFWLIHRFQSFPLKDPNLPTSLLPFDWVGKTARTLFDNYHQLLGTYANQYVDDVIQATNAKINKKDA
jgi:phenylacetic acid degradation operon negative regulatory protein